MEKIPKIFHQIWLGGKPLPKDFREYQQTWQKYNNEYKMHIWDETNISRLKYIDNSMPWKLKNFAEKADYLRFCILLEHGGIYIDTDFECLQNIENIIQKTEFFAAYDWREDWEDDCIGNGIIWSTPENELVRKIFLTFPKRIIQAKKLDSVNKIGPLYITPFIERYKGSKKIFDRNVFHPIKHKDYYVWVPINRHFLIKNWSYWIHHWANSWNWKIYWKKKIYKHKICRIFFDFFWDKIAGWKVRRKILNKLNLIYLWFN